MIACLQAAVHSAGYFGIHTVALAHIAAYTQYGIQGEILARLAVVHFSSLRDIPFLQYIVHCIERPFGAVLLQAVVLRMEHFRHCRTCADAQCRNHIFQFHFQSLLWL